MPDDPVEKLAQQIAEKHCAKSLAEMRDPEKVDQWATGPRAEEFSAAELEAALGEIVEPKTDDTEENDDNPAN